MYRYDGQRKHIIHSLSTLLYQLHVLSFLLSPAIWVLLARILSNFHLSAPRDLDPTRTLRFWFILIIIFNWGALWNHAKEGAEQGRSVVLDFIGLSYEPSKVHLLALDFFIIFLSMVLTTIAYEASYAADMPPDTVDSLLPLPTSSSSLLPLDAHEQVKTAYAIDLRLSTIVERLRHPPPPPPPRNASRNDLLPMPNITSLRLPTGLQMLLRARQQQRRRAMETAATRRPGGDDGGRGDGDTDDEDDDERQDVPGGLHADRT
ncbi:hypothetical protein DAEQUDRAFT_809332 [Daedalea quercina L-15889]|uniref:DUF1746 domain-containing protein n=1 Tax=Daedalea quercina L-15889 TaxID=1314783 RepID=A0A165SIU0_9APHY|nr:hypothetical protein DAEQUDRAFT_809332 [Daedalea quercina L-15889]